MPPVIRGLIRLSLGGVLAVLVLNSQQPAPVFRAGSKLVEIEVTALDKQGNPVTGLTAADFTIHDEGALRPVAFFRFDGAPPSQPAAAPPAPPDRLPRTAVVSNHTDPAGESPLNVCALVLDALNTPPEQNVQVRAQMMRYLKALAPRTRVAIFSMGQELRTLHDFTDDPTSLRARLEKATLALPLDDVTDFTRSVTEAEQLVKTLANGPAQEQAVANILGGALAAESMANSAARARRLERTLAAMEALGKHLAGIPGRKNLVWIGAGVSMFSLDTTGRPPYTIRNDFEPKVRSASRRLAQEGVVLYIVDSKGLKPQQEFEASFSRPRSAVETGNFERQANAENISADPTPAMRLMAGLTGGRYFFNTNDVTLGFQQVAADLRGSYTLGFYAPEAPDDKWHRLKIQVKRSGIGLRYREGYLFSAAPAQTPDWIAETFSAAFSNPVGSSAIPLTAALEAAPGGERLLKLTIGVNGIQFRPDNGALKATLRLALGELTADGVTSAPYTAQLAVNVPASKWEDAGKTGISFDRRWKPAADAGRVRVVVMDVTTGQYGSVDLKLR